MKLHPIWDDYIDFQPRLAEVADHMEVVLSQTPAMIREKLGIVLKPGKMLRPAFVLMASTAGPERHESLVKVAAAVELMHTATLIHDDIIDGARSRRGNPALHTESGLKTAVLAGDYLFAKALELAASADTGQLVGAVNEAVSRICLSEIEQDSEPGNYFIDRDTYIGRIRGKTAELFALSCRVGAVLGGASEKQAEDLYTAGLEFGLAFQIVDDVLDYRGLPEKTGKPAGNDLRDGIPTLPLILGLESGDSRLHKLCGSRFRIRLNGVIRRRVTEGGWVDTAAGVAVEYLDSCLSRLNSVEFGDRELFSALASRLIKQEIL